MADLNAHTKIPLGWALVIITVLGGFILGGVINEVQAHGKQIHDLDKRVALTEQAVVTLKDIHLELVRQRTRKAVAGADQ